MDACLRLTGAFEGGAGALAGNFDGQIVSWGPLQWNLGQGTLEPVLSRIYQADPGRFTQIMGPELATIMERERFTPGDQLLQRFAQQNILTPQGIPTPDWRERFQALANTPAARAAFRVAAQAYFDRASRLALECSFRTVRGYALCFDIAVQNGAPRRDHLSTFRARLGDGSRTPEEWQRLKLLAQVVADLANPRWKAVVLARKLTIALGETPEGMLVNGRRWRCEDFGVGYTEPWWVTN